MCPRLSPSTLLLATLLSACSSEAPATRATPAPAADAEPTPTPGAHAAPAKTPVAAPGKAPAAATDADGGPDQEEASAAQILVTHSSSLPRDLANPRTKDEARARATKLATKLAEGADFGDLARAESDHPSKARGGLIGTFKRRQLPPEFAEAIYALAVGQVSRTPLETAAGFHLFKRLPLEKVHARHILIRYHGATNGRGATRTKADAARIAADVRARVVAPGSDFAALAREYSEDPSSAQGGDVGEFGRGATVQAFDEVVFRLGINEVSQVVESEFGFHVIQRLP